MRPIAGVSWPLLVGAAAFMLVAALGKGLADSDVYLQIAAGQWMVGHGQVPTHDLFSFTMPGAPWVAHEWAAELLTLLAYRMAGWSGLVFMGAASFGATLAYLVRFLLRRMQALPALLLSGLAAGMMLPYLVDRAHEFVWPLTAVWIGGMVQASEGNRAPSWWLLAVMLLWANMHASFILGLGLMVLLAVESLENGAQNRLEIAKRWLPFMAASVVCALANPIGYRLLLYPFHLLGLKVLFAYFRIWQPPNLQQPQSLDVWIVAMVGLAMAGRIRLSFTRTLMVLGLLFMALQHSRDISLLGLISPLLLARPLSGTPLVGKKVGVLGRWLRATAQPARRTTVWVTLAFACVGAITALRVFNPRPPVECTPRAALDVVLASVHSPRILNDVDFGDYMIFRRVPVFVDTRAGVYGEKFLERTLATLMLTPGGNLAALLAKYDVNAVLVRPVLPVTELLNRLSGWQRVYAGKFAVAYVRKRALKG